MCKHVEFSILSFFINAGESLSLKSVCNKKKTALNNIDDAKD